jgi:hypothetical protein
MKDDPVLAQYVYRVAELPKLPPIVFESEVEKALVKKETDFYKALSLWLRNMVLGETLSPEAYKGIGRYYQPYAELWQDSNQSNNLRPLVLGCNTASVF